jgi:hypothetical protein
MNQSTKIENEKRKILSDLISATREISVKYNDKKKLVTENDKDILNFVNLWEIVLNFGLKVSLLNNVQELFNASSNGSMFWNFALQFLSQDEQKRFASFKNVCTQFNLKNDLIYDNFCFLNLIQFSLISIYHF